MTETAVSSITSRSYLYNLPHGYNTADDNNLEWLGLLAWPSLLSVLAWPEVFPLAFLTSGITDTKTPRLCQWAA